jgi:OPT oligopeptide transporter protein
MPSRVRALGETDLNPVSGLGKISQLFFAILQPGNVVANIIAGGVAEAGAQQQVYHHFDLTSDPNLTQSR